MEVLIRLLLALFSLLLTVESQAFPELPFCPAGGPPGWFNRLTHHRDHNRWYRNMQYNTPQYYQPAYISSQPYTPAYSIPDTYNHIYQQYNKPYYRNY
jgi:hypothetical protein